MASRQAYRERTDAMRRQRVALARARHTITGPWSDAETRALKRLRKEDGAATLECALSLGRTYDSVADRARKHPDLLVRRRWRPEEDEALLRMVLDLDTGVQFAAVQLGRSLPSVYTRLRSLRRAGYVIPSLVASGQRVRFSTKVQVSG